MSIPDGVRALEHDLRGICGPRLQSLVIYGRRAAAAAQHPHGHEHGHEHGHGHAGAPVRTMAIVDALTAADLRACASLTASWHERGLATPLVVAAHEFERSLDAFPLEFGAILADHELVAGANPFDGLTVDSADVRRACEVQARSHLLHLREGFLETRGRADALAVLIVESAASFAALIRSLARLETAASEETATAARHAERALAVTPGSIADIVALVGVSEISSERAERLFPPYLDVAEKLVAYVDGWSRRG